MSARFPRLVAKYGFKDSGWLDLKAQTEKAELNGRVSRQTADLIPKSGMIPGVWSHPAISGLSPKC